MTVINSGSTSRDNIRGCSINQTLVKEESSKFNIDAFRNNLTPEITIVICIQSGAIKAHFSDTVAASTMNYSTAFEYYIAVNVVGSVECKEIFLSAAILKFLSTFDAHKITLYIEGLSYQDNYFNVTCIEGQLQSSKNEIKKGIWIIQPIIFLSSLIYAPKIYSLCIYLIKRIRQKLTA